MKVFLDANVLFSASNSESAIGELVSLIKAQEEAVTSHLAVEEARRNILLKRPKWSPEFERVISGMRVVESMVFRLPVQLKEKDRPLLCAAIRAGCDFFVTGDKKDFGHLFGLEVEGVKVVTLLQMAEALAQKG